MINRVKTSSSSYSHFHSDNGSASRRLAYSLTLTGRDEQREIRLRERDMIERGDEKRDAETARDTRETRDMRECGDEKRDAERA